MKMKTLLTFLLLLFAQFIWACPVCDKQQPKITQGFTHGVGPQSKWDWVIIGVMTTITAFTFIYSIKFLVKPGEKNANHIKQSILNN